MSNGLILKKQDLTYLSWSRVRHSSGTAGSFLKAYSRPGGMKLYYKLSDFDSQIGVVGHKSVNELIVDRLLHILGVPHCRYNLIYADILINGKIYEAYVSASTDYKLAGESKIALDAYYDMEKHDGETPMDFCVRMGWADDIYKMLVVDYLILNRDRHGANIEVLRDRKKNTMRLAPMFDHGLSLLFSCHSDEEAEKFEVMADRPVNTFLGSKSTWQNLELIPKDAMPALNQLKESDRYIIMEGLDGILSSTMQNKIWEMIWKRWCAYEDFCDKR